MGGNNLLGGYDRVAVNVFGVVCDAGMAPQFNRWYEVVTQDTSFHRIALGSDELSVLGRFPRTATEGSQIHLSRAEILRPQHGRISFVVADDYNWNLEHKLGLSALIILKCTNSKRLQATVDIPDARAVRGRLGASSVSPDGQPHLALVLRPGEKLCVNWTLTTVTPVYQTNEIKRLWPLRPKLVKKHLGDRREQTVVKSEIRYTGLDLQIVHASLLVNEDADPDAQSKVVLSDNFSAAKQNNARYTAYVELLKVQQSLVKLQDTCLQNDRQSAFKIIEYAEGICFNYEWNRLQEKALQSAKRGLIALLDDLDKGLAADVPGALGFATLALGQLIDELQTAIGDTGFGASQI